MRYRALGALVGSLAAGIAWSQAYPVKPVRVVIPWPPGGANDVVGRVVMQKVGDALGQQFVVDNRGGAGGTIGADLVAKSLPDGYTLMVHSTTHVGNPHLYRKLPYDTLKDFTALGLLTSQTTVLTVHASLPAKTVKEFIALAKARPGQILYSSAGNGSAPHLSMALLAAMANIRLEHVPYKGGAPQVSALLAGESQASLATIATVIAHVKSGRLRALGVSSLKRSAVLPDVPTISEAGVPGYEMAPWVGVFGPAGMPRALVDRLNAECNKALKLPDVVQTLASQALDPWPGTPDEFAERLRVDHEKYGRLIRMTGAKVD